MTGRRSHSCRHATGGFACILIMLLAGSAAAVPRVDDEAFARAAAETQQRLEESVDELARLRAAITAEKLPLTRRLRELETELADVRRHHLQVTRALDGRALDQGTARAGVRARQDELSYLAGLLAEFRRGFEARLHIAELQRHRDVLHDARMAAEDTGVTGSTGPEADLAVLQRALDRLHEAMGGVMFEGTAVDPDGLLRRGQFLLVGPMAYFRSTDGEVVGTAEQRLGSLVPAVIPFDSIDLATTVSDLVATGAGRMPLDPTLGNAHRIAATRETFIEHVRKGGPVMIPIFLLAGAAALVALTRWAGLLLVRRPSPRRMRALLDAVAAGDRDAALSRARAVGGPTGVMLTAGVEHIGEPRELVEEVMYEALLNARLRLQRFLPFIAICASSAPLLGLLGTVTGIINTFKLITVFGSGDVRTLSGGISEALITTEFGLIVAIPSLLMHAYLARRARGIVDQMEKCAVTFINQVSRSPFGRATQENDRREAPPAIGRHDPPVDRSPDAQVRDILSDILYPVLRDGLEARTARATGAAPDAAPRHEPPAPAGMSTERGSA